jgi:hypothetical protein
LSRKTQDILEHILSIKGLNFSDIPKGLIPFHAYPEGPRTAFEEHLVEGAAYTKGENGRVRIHFTVSPEHEQIIKEHLENVKSRYEGKELIYELGLSTQKLSTDTLAVDLDNRPFGFRDGNSSRPGGHGALLGISNELGGMSSSSRTLIISFRTGSRKKPTPIKEHSVAI